MENARSAGLQILGEQDFPMPVDVFLVESTEQSEEILGDASWGWSDPAGRAVVLVVNDEGGGPFRHELMHVLSGNLWGFPSTPAEWISEGLAVFAEWRNHPCSDADEHLLAGYVARKDSLIPLPEIVAAFRQHPYQFSYVESASVVRFLLETYGRDTLRSIWQDGLKAALGMDFAALGVAWRTHLLESTAGVPQMDWRVFMEKGCR
jgi:hypothetical protein